jgi:hypothetical protein
VIDRITGNARSVDERSVATVGADPTVVGGRYELGALLGTGASAVVRRASDRITGRAFAVKLFHAGASAHDRRRQQREMRALATLHHPGLVALHDGGVEGDRPFIVTDLVEGPTLAERLETGPLDPDDVRRLGARLADALAHVHGGGIVHRDLKPANVLLGADGAKLADFGIARAVDGTAVTGTGYVVGTAAYLAPEQVRGEWVGPEADVYALGLVLLEALTGRREYPGALVESATARLHRPPGIPDGLPASLHTALETMTALEPAVRPTAAQVAAMLAVESCRGRRRGAHRRSAGRHASPRIAGAATILAVAAAVTAAAMPSAEPAPVPQPTVRSEPVVGVVPAPDASSWLPASAVATDRVAATLGDGADAARQRAAAKALKIPQRTTRDARTPQTARR